MNDDELFEQFKREVLGAGKKGAVDLAEGDDRLFENFKRNVLAGSSAGSEEPPINEDEAVKADLLRQHREYHFGTPDPSDGLSDDELWEAMPKTWREA